MYFYEKTKYSRFDILKKYRYAEEKWETDDLAFEPLDSSTILSLLMEEAIPAVNLWVNNIYSKYVATANITLKLGALLIGRYLKAKIIAMPERN